MREQRHTLAAKWRTKSGFGDKSIDAKFHDCTVKENSYAKQSA